jgi:hypothetical protein
MSRWLTLGAGALLLSALPRTLHGPVDPAGPMAASAPVDANSRARGDSSRIAVVAPATSGTWLRGARLGMEEGRRAASLLRRHVELIEVASGSDPAAVAEREAEAGTLVLVAALEHGQWEALETAAAGRNLVLIDARPRYPPGSACPPGAFRIGIPSRGDADRHSPALWHESLVRYGAAQLNERYRREFREGMDEAAWSGWFAVKVATETVLRVGEPVASAVEDFLTSRGAAFDGHKGQPLRFDPASRSLVHPVYVTSDPGTRVEIEWPGAPSCGTEPRGAS